MRLGPVTPTHAAIAVVLTAWILTLRAVTRDALRARPSRDPILHPWQ